jgi:hypothetical protein
VSLGKGEKGPAHGSGEAAAGVEPVVVAVDVGPHAPAAAAAPPAAGFKARPGERVVELWLGRFPFSEVAPGDHLIGYGVHCGRRVNDDGTVASTPCIKMVTVGKSGLRLERWLVFGFTGHLDAGHERQSHIGMGGVHLSLFDTVGSGCGDIPESDLDELIAGLP